MQHQREAYISDLGDGIHVTCFWKLGFFIELNELFFYFLFREPKLNDSTQPGAQCTELN